MAVVICALDLRLPCLMRGVGVCATDEEASRAGESLLMTEQCRDGKVKCFEWDERRDSLQWLTSVVL